MPFTHLHVHSHYSVQDGMSKVNELVDKCQRTGMHAMALTDHGNMFGIKDFLDYSKKVNGKPKGKVKDCEENIRKAKEQIGMLPQWEEELKSATTPHDIKDLTTKIEDAHKAEKELPLLEEELPTLKKKAEEYIPFKPIVGVEAYCARRSRLSKDKDYKESHKDENGEVKTQIVDRSGWHLILLAKNMTGYHNLCRIVSLGFIEGFYDRPRIDKELLAQYHEGIIVSSACLGGELPQLIMRGDVDEAEKSIRWFKSVFGDDYYIEIQRHQTDKPGGDQHTFEKQQQVNPILIELAKKTNTKIICTNDAHFVEEEHAEAHDRLICLATGTTVDNPKRMHYTKQEWLKTPEEMAAIFGDIPEAMENTQEIVDKVEVYDIDSAPIMPKFPIPEEFGTEEDYRKRFSEEDLFNEFTRNEKGEVVIDEEAATKKVKKLGGYDKLYRIKLEADYLAMLTWKGARKRYPELIEEGAAWNLNEAEAKADWDSDKMTERQHDIVNRIRFELHVMKTMGFPGYFLIVMDYIRAAREELGVSVGPGRGSAAGSVVAYCLWITDLDPLKYDLLFERFLNPDRISLPDIDVDFDDAGREKVLEWVSNKYGKTHVAHIITYGTMATKSAVADVGRVQDVPLSKVNEIKGFIPDKFPDEERFKDAKGKTLSVNLHNCYDKIDELRALLYGEDKNVGSMLHYAEQLEGTIRQLGIHACGVIIGADDLTKFAPLATVRDKNLGDIMVTEYDGHVVESVGLIKMDFLGLKTLTIIKEALKNVRLARGEEVDIDHIPTDDELTYKLFQEGKTVAVFQFESAGMQKYMKELKPTCISDLIAMNALYRPGPIEYIPSFIKRKNGQEPITYDIPIMDTYLKDTYGITVYQEQVMLLSQLLANFTKGEADTLRKAMGKKQFAMLMQLKPKFIEQGKKNGHDPEILEKIWKDWEAFASYAFNKSHAACYAWVAYQTAYLKAHYPAEFMAANLTDAKSDITEVTKLMDECRAMGIGVLSPDVNESELNFTVNHQGDIRFGLGGVKGVGEAAVEAIIGERKKNGTYKSIFDFLERVNLQACNKKTIESLALAGAFDCFEDAYREQIVGVNERGENMLDLLVKYGQKYQGDKGNDEQTLFGGFDDMAVEIKRPQFAEVPRYTTIQRLNIEKSLIGIYLSAHPLDEYRFELDYLCNVHSAEMLRFDELRRFEKRPAEGEVKEGELSQEDFVKSLQGHTLHWGGLVTSAETGTYKDEPMGKYTIEDYEGQYSFALFGDNYRKYAHMLQMNTYVFVTGNITAAGATKEHYKPRPFAETNYYFNYASVESLSTAQNKLLTTLEIYMTIDNLTRELINDLQEELVKSEKEQKEKQLHSICSLEMYIYDSLHEKHIRMRSKHFSVHISPSLYRFLEEKKAQEVLNFHCKING